MRRRVLDGGRGLIRVLTGEQARADQPGGEFTQAQGVERRLLTAAVHEPKGKLGVHVTQAGSRQGRGQL